MKKEKIIRLVYTILIALAFFGGFTIGINDKKVKMCSNEDMFFMTVDGIEGCLEYHGEYCKDNNYLNYGNLIPTTETEINKLRLNLNGSSS